MVLWKVDGLKLIYIISFLDLFAVGLTFPVLAPYIRSLGSSHVTVGVISSVYSLLQVLSGPIIGSWSDIRGKKSVFIITLLSSCVCYFLLGFSTSIYSIFLLRVALGVVKHTQTINKAIVVDLISHQDNSKVYGKCSAYGAIGFVIGPIIGGHLSELKSGFTYICSMTSLLFLLNIGLVLLLPDVSKPKKCSQINNHGFLLNIQNEITKAIRDLTKVKWKVHWVSFLLKFLFTLSTTTYFATQPLYLKENFNLSQKHVGYAISFVSIIGVISAFLLGTITQAYYKKDKDCFERSLHSFVVLTLCFIGFYYSPNYYVLLILLIPFGICNSILRIITMEIMFNYSGDNDKGSLSGASDSVMSLARFIAPLSAGCIGDMYGNGAVMLFALIPCIIGSAISFYFEYGYYIPRNVQHNLYKNKND